MFIAAPVAATTDLQGGKSTSPTGSTEALQPAKQAPDQPSTLLPQNAQLLQQPAGSLEVQAYDATLAPNKDSQANYWRLFAAVVAVAALGVWFWWMKRCLKLVQNDKTVPPITVKKPKKKVNK